MKKEDFTRALSGRWLGLLCVLLALLVHAHSIQGEAVLDDRAVFLENPSVQGPLTFDAVFASNVFGGKPGYERAGGYRPLTLLTFRIGPSDSLWFQRLLNLIFHALTVWALWLLVIELGFKDWAAAFGVSVFALHPVHVDAIVPLNNRSDLLCTFLLLSSLWCWLRARDRRLGVVAVGLGVLAALSKEQGLLAPFFLAVPTLVWWRRFKLDGGAGRVVRWRWGFIALSLLFSLLVLFLRSRALGGSLTGLVPPSDNPLVVADLPGRVLAPGVYLLKAVQLLVYPLNLSADYTRDVMPPPVDWASLMGWLGLLIFGLWGAASLRQLWRGRMVSALCLCGAFMAYLVTSNLLVLSTISFSERALYLPSAFLSLGLCMFMSRIYGEDEKGPKFGVVLSLILLLSLSGLTLVSVDDYRNNGAIAQASVLSTPRSARMHTLLGESLMDRGDAGRAGDSFRRALEYDPGSAYAYRGLGRIQFKSGAFDEAARMYENAILHSRGGMMEAYNDACLSHLRAGAYDKALERCHAGLMRAPEEAVLMTNTARVYLALGKMNDAIHWARLGHQKKPLQFYPLWHLLLVTLESGDRPATELLWIKAKKQKPGDKTLLQFARQFGFE